MKDYEIILMLKNINPENETQKRALELAESAFRSATDNEIEDKDAYEFLDAYSREELINVSSGDLYNEYFNFCEKLDVTPISQNLLTRMAKRKFNLTCRVIRDGEKICRAFK